MLNRIHTAIRIEPSTLSELDKFSQKLGISRNQLIINLVAEGLEDLRLLNSCGLLVVGKGLRELVDKVRKNEPMGNQTTFNL